MGWARISCRAGTRPRTVPPHRLIRRDGKRIWRGKCASDPKLITGLIRKHAPMVRRVVFETGPLSVWFYHALTAEGLPAICIDARHAKAALDMAANKTDANDADGLARLAEVGFFREVRVKGFDSMLARTLVAARTRLVRITTELSNQIRGFAIETLRTAYPRRQGKYVREKCSRTPRRSGSVGSDRAAASGGLARHAQIRAGRNLGVNSSLARARAARVEVSCRSPVSARSPRPRSRPRSKIRRTFKKSRTLCRCLGLGLDDADAPSRERSTTMATSPDEVINTAARSSCMKLPPSAS